MLHRNYDEYLFLSSSNIDSLQLCHMKKIPTSLLFRFGLSLQTPAVIDVQTSPAFSIWYLMRTRLPLMPTFEANRSEPSWREMSRREKGRFEGKWKAWPKQREQIRGEVDGVREELGKCLIRRLDAWYQSAFCSDGITIKKNITFMLTEMKC